MHADIRYSGPKALLQAPEVELDTLQSFGGCLWLPRMLSPSLALRHQLKGDPIKLSDAVRFGLLTEVVENADPFATQQRAFEDAMVIAHKKPNVVQLNLKAVRCVHRVFLRLLPSYFRCFVFLYPTCSLTSFCLFYSVPRLVLRHSMEVEQGDLDKASLYESKLFGETFTPPGMQHFLDK